MKQPTPKPGDGNPYTLQVSLGEQSQRVINLEYSTDGSLLFYLVYRNLKPSGYKPQMYDKQAEQKGLMGTCWHEGSQ